jgi:hypothetical protein
MAWHGRPEEESKGQDRTGQDRTGKDGIETQKSGQDRSAWDRIGTICADVHQKTLAVV